MMVGGESGTVAWLGRGLAFLSVVLWSGDVCGQQYSLNFSKTSSRMTWNHQLPSWNYATPVRLSARRDSTSMLRISTSASMSSTLDERSDGRNWQDNASINTSIRYPILGPKASVRIGANMSVRSATLTKQKIRNQSFNFGFQFSPLQKGRFRSLKVNVTPGLITASRATRANLDSTFEEHGIQYTATMRVQPEVSLAGRKLRNSLSISQTDNTLKSNRSRRESYTGSVGYTLPGDIRTSINASESRSQVGLPRSITTEQETEDGDLVRDTVVVVETQRTRNTTIRTSVGLKVRRFDVKVGSTYGENLRINSASSDDDANNSYFARDRENKRWSLDASVSGKLVESLVGRTSMRVNGSDERFLPVRLANGLIFRDPSSDLGNRDLFVNGSLEWQPNHKHAVKLSAYTELKSRENPGAPEQDRDTQSNSISLNYSGKTSSGASVTARLESRYVHRVNLHASRSAGNSRNRDLSMSFNTRYQRLGVSFSHAFSISARRTIYDFDREVNLGQSLRKSNIRRGWSMVHTVQRQLFERIQLNGRYAHSADDFGVLLVERGAQIVEEDNSDHSVSFGLSYRPTDRLSTSANYSYGLDRQWQYEYDNRAVERYLKTRRERENFSVSANYNAPSGTKLTLRGSRSRQLSGTFDSFTVSYSRPL